MPNGTGTGFAPGRKLVIELPPVIPGGGIKNKGKVFVNPGRINLGSAPSVQWINNTRGTAHLWFPHAGEIFKAGSANFSNPIDILAGATSPELFVITDPPGPTLAEYRYSVFCDEIEDFARGNSEPQLDVP